MKSQITETCCLPLSMHDLSINEKNAPTNVADHSWRQSRDQNMCGGMSSEWKQRIRVTKRIRRRPNADATETPSPSARLFASLFSTLATLTDKPFVFFFDGRHAVVFAQQAGKKKREVATLASESGAADSSLRQHFRVGGGPRKRHLPPTLADKARSGADTRAVNHRESGAVADFFPQPQRPVQVHSRSNDKGAATSCVSTPAPDLTG